MIPYPPVPPEGLTITPPCRSNMVNRFSLSRHHVAGKLFANTGSFINFWCTRYLYPFFAISFPSFNHLVFPNNFDNPVITIHQHHSRLQLLQLLFLHHGQAEDHYLVAGTEQSCRRTVQPNLPFLLRGNGVGFPPD